MEHIARQCHRRWIPKWAHAFAEGGGGLFHERLDFQFLPVNVGRRRLLTQCRQLAVYAHHLANVGKSTAGIDAAWIDRHFDTIIDAYYVPESGGWRFALGEGYEQPLYDLYTHAFVMFMCVWVWRATGSQKAQRLAVSTRFFIRERFTCGDGCPGFAEQLDEDLRPIPQMRRQDPHMHLLEAALLAYESWGLAEDAALAGDLVGLFRDYFWDEAQGCLVEDYDHNLQPHPDQGDICEPGHHFEWVWLLWWYEKAVPGAADSRNIRRRLLDFGNKNGYDARYGGIFNAVTKTGAVSEEDKRIWPVTEALKANAIMLDEVDNRDKVKNMMWHLVSILASGYVHRRGFWTETLNRDLSVQTDIMPGTTPYHLYFGVMEALEILKARGQSKSWRSAWIGLGYHLRRSLSDMMRASRQGWMMCYSRGKK